MPAYDPAVSALNGKIEGYGGSFANKTLYGAAGSLTAPIGGQYGAQIDGNVGSLDGSTFGTIGGHWFWRNPNQGLLGIYGAWTGWDRFGGVNVGHVAGEGEYYFGQFTLQGVAGVEFGNTASQTSVAVTPFFTFTTVDSFDIKTRFFDLINLKYYFSNDLSGYVGHRYRAARMRWRSAPNLRPLGRGTMASAFVEGRVGARPTRAASGAG